MPRIKPADRDTAGPATVELLSSVRKSMGAVPNLIATMAHSPAVARAYLGFAQALAEGSLPRRLLAGYTDGESAGSWPTPR